MKFVKTIMAAALLTMTLSGGAMAGFIDKKYDPVDCHTTTKKGEVWAHGGRNLLETEAKQYRFVPPREEYALGGRESLGGGINDQEKDNWDSVGGYGYYKPPRSDVEPRIVFDKLTLKALIDPRFDPSKGSDMAIRKVKSILRDIAMDAADSILSSFQGNMHEAFTEMEAAAARVGPFRRNIPGFDPNSGDLAAEERHAISMALIQHLQLSHLVQVDSGEAPPASVSQH